MGFATCASCLERLAARFMSAAGRWVRLDTRFPCLAYIPRHHAHLIRPGVIIMGLLFTKVQSTVKLSSSGPKPRVALIRKQVYPLSYSGSPSPPFWCR